VRSALQWVSRTESLQSAWGAFISNASPRSRKSAGVDQESLFDFDRNPTAGCRALLQGMRSPAGYSFSALRAIPIPKDNGKYRIICVPTVRDRIVQRAVNGYLAKDDKCGLANEVSYGFIPNRSVKKAVARARDVRREKSWVYKTDIAAFFDSVDRQLLSAHIRRRVRDRSLHPILISASCCEIDKPNRSIAKRIFEAGIVDGRGVRQGMPLSPFFANLLLRNFDRAIVRAGIPMIRYADDLLCLAGSESECQAIHLLVRAALAKEGLAVPDIGEDSKTRIYGPEEPADFLGLQLTPRDGDYLLEVPAKQTAKIRARILNLADLSAPQNQGITATRFFARLDGVIAGYLGAYEFAHNANHFESCLEVARQDSVALMLRKVLKVEVDELDSVGRHFLGISDPC
jgi:RNA-directed DNA polymerase